MLSNRPAASVNRPYSDFYHSPLRSLGQQMFHEIQLHVSWQHVHLSDVYTLLLNILVSFFDFVLFFFVFRHAHAGM
jgi:hypothetical protein